MGPGTREALKKAKYNCCSDVKGELARSVGEAQAPPYKASRSMPRFLLSCETNRKSLLINISN